MYKTIRLLVFLLLVIATSSFAQQTVFYDSLSKIANTGYASSSFTDSGYTYISGYNSFDSFPSFKMPTLHKVDANGKTVWSATDHDNAGRFINQAQGLLRSVKAGNKVYAVSAFYDSDSYLQTTWEIWCISDSSGALLWKTAIEKSEVVQLKDYDNNFIIAITRKEYSNQNIDYYYYNLINKETGKVLFTKLLKVTQYSQIDFAGIDVLVDDHKDILINLSDTCKKYRGAYLSQMVWETAYFTDLTFSMLPVRFIMQDAGRYILVGNCVVRSVDSATGNTVWVKNIRAGYIGQPVYIQPGSYSCRPAAYVQDDSLLYVTWSSLYVGSSAELERGFTLTRLNKNTGDVRFNVAYDFTGVPRDTVPDPFSASEEAKDWPVALCIDASKNIYITGTYDGDNPTQGPWGIMKIDGKTGAKIYEATITSDSTARPEYYSKGGFAIQYSRGKVFCTGNLVRGTYTSKTDPLLVCFDTAAVYAELFRKNPDCLYRYTSGLDAASAFGTNKVLLFKRVGRSAIIEMRNESDVNLWSRLYSRQGKFMLPGHLFTMANKSIAASMFLYSESPASKFEKGKPDSIIFMKLDSTGNVMFRHSLLYNLNDSIRTSGIYEDTLGRVNFIFNTNKPQFSPGIYYRGYTLGSTVSAFGTPTGVNETYNNIPSLRLTCFQHHNGDTMIAFIPSAANMLSTVQRPIDGSYPSLIYQSLSSVFQNVYSTVKLGNRSYFATGRNTNGRAAGKRYDFIGSIPLLVWQYEIQDSGVMINADTSRYAIYCFARKNNGNFLITKLNKETGSKLWGFERPADSFHTISPLNFKFNQRNNTLSITGFTSDSAVAGARQTYFYWVLDSLGNVIRDINQTGVGIGGNKVKDLAIFQDNNCLFGGETTDVSLGTVGFYNYSNLLTSPCSNNNYNYWIGSVDNNWENAANWSCARVPDSTTRVYINNGTVLLNTNTIVYSITVMPGVNLTVGSGSFLTVLH